MEGKEDYAKCRHAVRRNDKGVKLGEPPEFSISQDW